MAFLSELTFFNNLVLKFSFNVETNEANMQKKWTFTLENSLKREMCFTNSESPLRILTYLDLPCLISTNNSNSFQKLEAVVQRSSIKKGVLKNFAKFPRKRLWQSLFFK